VENFEQLLGANGPICVHFTARNCSYPFRCNWFALLQEALYGGARRRAEGHDHWVPGSCRRVTLQAVDHLPPVAFGQRVRLPLRRQAKSLSGTRSETHPHQGVHTADQRQGGTLHQDTPGGVCLRHRLPDLRGTQPLATPLFGI
jgi:hypothetical protein